MKKWLVTRISHVAIEVESDVKPEPMDDNWAEESYRDGTRWRGRVGSVDWEVTELEAD